MDLVSAKMRHGTAIDGSAVYQIDFTFGSPVVVEKSEGLGQAKEVHMQFMAGMSPKDLVRGLRDLANHLATDPDFKDADKGG